VLSVDRGAARPGAPGRKMALVRERVRRVRAAARTRGQAQQPSGRASCETWFPLSSYQQAAYRQVIASAAIYRDGLAAGFREHREQPGKVHFHVNAAVAHVNPSSNRLALQVSFRRLLVA
jgi:hypothetical protein